MKKRNIIIFAVASLLSLPAIAQQQVTGVVKNKQGNPVAGVAVIAVGNPAQKSITDANGFFTLNVDKGEYIELNYSDAVRKRVWVDHDNLTILLEQKDLLVENQSKIQSIREQTQAISTIKGEEISSKNSAVNVGNALYGMLPGLIVKQNTGWTDGATLMVRGGGSLTSTSPLVVVDGVPRSLNDLNMLEIESISVLKDGAATALWGTRGSNGVIVVKTKRGDYNSRHIDVSYTYGIGLPINQPEFVDGYTYARMKNEALYYDGLPLQYDRKALEAFQKGTDLDAYPNTDWSGIALRNHTNNHQLNFTFSGGGKKLRYYSAINYKNDYGILSDEVTKYSDRYNAQMKKFYLSARMNLDIDVTSYTKARLSMFGLLNQQNRPRTTEENIFLALFNVPSGAFPMKTTTG